MPLMTREEVDRDPWFGEQRAKVIALIERIEELERERTKAVAEGERNALRPSGTPHPSGAQPNS